MDEDEADQCMMKGELKLSYDIKPEKWVISETSNRIYFKIINLWNKFRGANPKLLRVPSAKEKIETR
jgi:hypothetical protein